MRSITKNAELELKTFTILVTDIRNFSSVSRLNSPKDIAYLINQFISTVYIIADEIEKEGKLFINSFLGDGFLIFFESNIDAVVFSLELNTRFKSMMKADTNIQDIGKLGIKTGIHRGDVIYNTFWYGDYNYETGIGHDVNMTFRLANAATKWEILVTQTVWRDINTRTINTSKDKLYVKGAMDVIWPYSIMNFKNSAKNRDCCEHCKRYKFCKFNFDMGLKHRIVDPYASNDHTMIKYKCNKNMLCAFPDDRVIPDEVPSYEEEICGGCIPDFDQTRKEYARNCERNMIRGYHGVKYRECCDDCVRFNTCLFNLHRGKNDRTMNCCQYCDYYYKVSCLEQIKDKVGITS